MRRFGMIALGLALTAALLAAAFAFASRVPNAKGAKIATELITLHQQWDTHTNVPALYESLTNLPFHKGGVAISRGCVARHYKLLGVRWDEYYFVSQPATNTPAWRLYHAWYWHPPLSRQKELMTRKVLTITN